MNNNTQLYHWTLTIAWLFTGINSLNFHSTQVGGCCYDHFYGCRDGAQSPFSWGLPPDWYFVEYILGTINLMGCSPLWYSRLFMTGVIHLSSLIPLHTSLCPLLSSLGFCLTIFCLAPTLLTTAHSGPWCSHLQTLYLTVSLVWGVSVQMPPPREDPIFPIVVSYLLFFLHWRQASWGSALVSFTTVFFLSTIVPTCGSFSEHVLSGNRYMNESKLRENNGHVSFAPCRWWGPKRGAGCVVSTQ